MSRTPRITIWEVSFANKDTGVVNQTHLFLSHKRAKAFVDSVDKQLIQANYTYVIGGVPLWLW